MSPKKRASKKTLKPESKQPAQQPSKPLAEPAKPELKKAPEPVSAPKVAKETAPVAPKTLAKKASPVEVAAAEPQPVQLKAPEPAISQKRNASAKTAEEPPAPQAQTQPQEAPVVSYPQRDALNIIHVASELAPVAKVGGLGDVVNGLCRELEIRGNNVEIILPKYDCMRYDHIWGLCESFKDLWVPWYSGAVHCTVWFGFVHGRKCFFIEPHSGDNFFNRGCFYGHQDDIFRFVFFARAAIEFIWQSGKNPDIIHCHDWQTGLLPVFLYEIYQHLGMTHPRVCYTVHNFRHQGVHGTPLLQATGLNRPDYYFHPDRLRDNNNPTAINCMKGGIVYSNFVTTVSPRHAWEAKNEGQGFGMEHTLHVHECKYGGVINGVDYDVWNPEIDRYIPHHYGVETIDDKYKNKKALRERLWLADNQKPIIAFVGRLDPQKGLDLVRHALFHTLFLGGQFILLGSSPDGGINSYFWQLKNHLNDSHDCHLEIGYDEELSHLIYAGADMVIVPSRYEPCGLTQMIAMRYGTIPLVRSCGGLADTVFDKDYADRPLHERNGYVFYQDDNAAVESALSRAVSCYYEFPQDFRELMKHAMRFDYSWNHPGEHYLNIYHHIRA